jgi:hypothetical protein
MIYNAVASAVVVGVAVAVLHIEQAVVRWWRARQ